MADLDHLANATEAMAETAAQWRDIPDALLQDEGEEAYSESDALA